MEIDGTSIPLLSVAIPWEPCYHAHRLGDLNLQTGWFYNSKTAYGGVPQTTSGLPDPAAQPICMSPLPHQHTAESNPASFSSPKVHCQVIWLLLCHLLHPQLSNFLINYASHCSIFLNAITTSSPLHTHTSVRISTCTIASLPPPGYLWQTPLFIPTLIRNPLLRECRPTRAGLCQFWPIRYSRESTEKGFFSRIYQISLLKRRPLSSSPSTSFFLPRMQI